MIAAMFTLSVQSICRVDGVEAIHSTARALTPILIDMCMVNHASSATSHPHAHFLSGSGVESTICHTWLTLSASILFEMNEGKDEEERNTPGMYVFHVRPRPRVMDPRNVIQRASRSSHAAFRKRGTIIEGGGN